MTSHYKVTLIASPNAEARTWREQLDCLPSPLVQEVVACSKEQAVLMAVLLAQRSYFTVHLNIPVVEEVIPAIGNSNSP